MHGVISLSYTTSYDKYNFFSPTLWNNPSIKTTFNNLQNNVNNFPDGQLRNSFSIKSLTQLLLLFRNFIARDMSASVKNLFNSKLLARFKFSTLKNLNHLDRC